LVVGDNGGDILGGPNPSLYPGELGGFLVVWWPPLIGKVLGNFGALK